MNNLKDRVAKIVSELEDMCRNEGRTMWEELQAQLEVSEDWDEIQEWLKVNL